MAITVIIPAYNEAARIAKTIAAIKPYASDILVIDDGSQDDTSIQAQNAGARVVRQPRNQGYIAAIKRGFAEATGEIVVTIDADGEFPAHCIPDLVKPIIEGNADMVQGARDIVPRPSEKILTGLAALRAPVGDSGTGFRALRTTLARQLTLELLHNKYKACKLTGTIREKTG